MSPERIDTRADEKISVEGANERVDVRRRRRMIRVMNGGTPHGYDLLDDEGFNEMADAADRELLASSMNEDDYVHEEDIDRLIWAIFGSLTKQK